MLKTTGIIYMIFFLFCLIDKLKRYDHVIFYMKTYFIALTYLQAKGSSHKFSSISYGPSQYN